MVASGAEDAEVDGVTDPVDDPAAAEAVDDHSGADGAGALLGCPSCGSAQVAQVLGDNGGVSYVCTSCGHSWS
ncbi:hypothetical protein [Streptomyces sp. NPDC053755]|uniref:hypothetical protein n=1 Tax=Streptomyces sp. NPDC053755 TaxID=3155815 RepID=UPI003423A7C7